MHTYVIQFFFSLVKNHIFHQIQVVLVVITFKKLWCFMIEGTYFFGFNHAEFIHHIVNNSVVFLFFWNLSLSSVLLLQSLVGWAAAYLVSNFTKNLHSSEEFTAPWIIQVFNALFKLYTYRLRCLPALPSFKG